MRNTIEPIATSNTLKALQPYGVWRRNLPLPPKGAQGPNHRLRKIVRNCSNYLLEIQTQLRRGISLLDIARTQFSLYLPVAPTPPVVSIEFTNFCNLRCTYCTSVLNLRPKGMMTDTVFFELCRQIKEH